LLQWDSENTFFYCDPPYVGADQGHYGGYSEEDLGRLCEALENVKGDFLLSTYPSAVIPSEWEAIALDATSTAAKSFAGKRPETIYRKRKLRKKAGAEQLSLLPAN